MNFSYIDPQTGQTYSLTLEAQADGAFVVRLDGRAYRVRATRDGAHGWRLHIDGQPVRAFVAAEGAARYVQAGDAAARMLTVPETQRTRRRATGGTVSGEAALMAQMPGQIIEVYAQAGDPVTTGQTLAVLEAMKMELRVVAPLDGVVGAVHVRKGAVVARDQRLFDIRPADQNQRET